MNRFAATLRLAALALLFVPPALAAPFCITGQVLPPQCIYYDAQQCERDAGKQGQVCSANPTEVTLSRGAGLYCVVTSGRVSVCAYTDRGTCAREARQQNGICTEAPARSGGVGAPDPYSPINGN